MNRATVVYVGMLIALIGGLWAVLAIGSTLSAPSDLAGKWLLSPMHPGDQFGPNMTIEQSGRFLQISFDHGPELNLKLTEQTANHAVLKNSDYQITLDGSDDQMHLVIAGAGGGEWSARRTARQFPADISESSSHVAEPPATGKERN